jgi:prepilin-type N-terminal cleavage/methylation domain-containing protein
MYMTTRNHEKGFTIVELLIVIVVIGILAAISIVAFNGVQTRARDTDRKNDLASISRLLHMYATDKGDYVSAGTTCAAGYNGLGYGWYHNDYDGSATAYKSISQCIIDGGYTTQVLNDPQSSKGCAAVPNTTPTENECFYYMKYECAGSTYLFTNLEDRPHSTTDTDGTCMTTLDSLYGMNYYIKVN